MEYSVNKIMPMEDLCELLIAHFEEISKDAKHLFEVDLDKEKLWNLYLKSFPAGTNEIYRQRRVHDCAYCKKFIKNFGNVVVIKDNKVHTIWDFNTGDDIYQPVMNALDAFVKQHRITEVYITKTQTIGTKENFELLENGDVKKWTHFYITLRDEFVDSSEDTEDTVRAMYRDRKHVFGRSLEEISKNSLVEVLDMIGDNFLYRGDEWKWMLEKFLAYKKEYATIPEKERECYLWVNSAQAGDALGRIRNHAIGTLLLDLTKGVSVETAVRKYDAKVAPDSYMRPSNAFTQRMLASAKKTIEHLGYMESLPRRHAVLDDITVNDILFFNRDAAKRIQGAMDIFSKLEKKAVDASKKFDHVEEKSYQEFISEVLPSARDIQLYFENRHVRNMVTLISPVYKEAKSMLKWGNNFSWSYIGNMTDSMKERVKAAGGKVDGVLRFSIQWNTSGEDNSDLDAHCIEPNKNHIYFGNCRKPYYSKLGGQLDVDITHPNKDIAVENITWASKDRMLPGIYEFFVHQFNWRNSQNFTAEIEFDGVVYSFSYNRPVRDGEKVPVADVILHENGTFSIVEKLPSVKSAAVTDRTSKEVWNLKTNEFFPVSVICYSPNHWDGSSAIGPKHVFFMLKDCLNNENLNGFYNQYLDPKLAPHKHVFEALGSEMSVEYSNDQLSGLGFSTTKRDDVVVKVKNDEGEKTYRVTF